MLLDQVLVLRVQWFKLVWTCVVVDNKAEIVLFLLNLGGLGSGSLLFCDDSGAPSSVEFSAGVPFDTLGFDLGVIDLQLS